MHWTNAVAMIVMIGSGWGIYNDSVIFGFLHFPQAVRIGSWAAESLLWHFAGMWLLALNGLAYLIYGVVTGRLRERLLPIRPSEVIATVRDTLHFKIKHEDLTTYNAVQKLLYIVVILAGISQVVTGIAIWKPVQFSGLADRCSAASRAARLVHFLGMAVIVGFLVVHVALALLVPATLRAMLTGGPHYHRKQGYGSPPMRSLFRPAKVAGPGHPVRSSGRWFASIERRGLLRGGLSLGALDDADRLRRQRLHAVGKALRAISAFNDKVQAALFDPE